MGPLLRKIHLKRHVHPNLHGSTASKSQTTEATNREIDTGLDNMTWTKHTWERHEAIQQKERMPLAVTKKDLVRTPGSQAHQTEEDQYHTVSLPGGSSKFNHIDSLRKETPTHTLKTHLVFQLEKPQRGIRQGFGSSQTYGYKNRPPRGPTDKDREPYSSSCTTQTDRQYPKRRHIHLCGPEVAVPMTSHIMETLP